MAEMAHRLAPIETLRASESEDAPAFRAAEPIERRPPPLGLHRRPAVGQPELRPLVTAVLDEGEIVAAGDRPRREAEWLEPDLVARSLIVEGEAAIGMADLMQSARELDP